MNEVSFRYYGSVKKGAKFVYGVKGGVRLGFGGIVGWCIVRGVDWDIYAEVDSDYVILYLSFTVDMILVILMDPSVVWMMEKIWFN